MKEDDQLSEFKQKYDFVQSVRKFPKQHLVSFYYQPVFKKQKKYKAITYQGYRCRLDLETGELGFYDNLTALSSKRSSVTRTKILLGMLLSANTFDWFLTFTFDKLKIDRTNEAVVYFVFVKFLKSLKRKLPYLGYVVVPERHQDRCIHFHMLLQMNGYTPFDLGFTNSGKVCCSWATKKQGISSRLFFEMTKKDHELKITDGLPVYNVGLFKYGYTTATKIASLEACCSYVKKYISKNFGQSTDMFKKRFYYSRNLNQPEIVKTIIAPGLDYAFNLNYGRHKFDIVSKYEETLENNKDITRYFHKEFNNLQYWVPSELNERVLRTEDDVIPLEDCEMPFDEQMSFVDILLKGDDEN